MNPLQSLATYIPYLFVRLFWSLYRLIPAAKAYDLGASFTRAFYPLFVARRRIAIDNILKAGVTSDPAEADRIARQAFGHLAGHLCEALRVGEVVGPDNWREHIAFDGPEESWKLLMETPDVPVMILTGHHGTWEAAVSIISMSRPMIAIARKMNNPYIDRFLKQHHFRGKITIISKSMGFTPHVMRMWADQRAAMTLLMDQRAGPQHGIPAPFMGRMASTHTSPARLHLKTGAPILVGSFIRDGAFHYRMVTGTPIRYVPSADRGKDIETLTSEINRRLGDIVRRYPEQYLWAHNRWR